MAKAGLVAARGVGIFAGLLGVVHGYYETQQGSVAPGGVIITAIGNGCQGFNNCLPAMTVVPNFLWSGILTIILSLLVLLFSAVRIQTRRGPLVLALLSIVLLLVGGGFLPPLLGLKISVYHPEKASKDADPFRCDHPRFCQSLPPPLSLEVI